MLGFVLILSYSHIGKEPRYQNTDFRTTFLLLEKS